MNTEALGSLIAKTMEANGLNPRDVERNSKKGGREGVTHSHVNKIKNGDIKDPSVTILEAVANGLGLPVMILIKTALDISLGKNEIAGQISEYVDVLPNNRRKDLLDFAKLFYDQEMKKDSENKAKEDGREGKKKKPVVKQVSGVNQGEAERLLENKANESLPRPEENGKEHNGNS